MNSMNLSLKDREWKEFVIENLFSIKIGKNIDGNKINKYSGVTAYITRKETNNGLDGFIKFDEKFLNSDHPVITIGNETAEPYVQNYPFFTGTKVNILIPKFMVSKDILLFISQVIKMHKNKYSYSYTINSTRLKKQRILLPINSKGEPDYEFMEAYMRAKEKEKTNVYKNYISKRIRELENTIKVIHLSEKNWGEFEIRKIFEIKAGKRLTKSEMIKGKKPFIGASDNNNGITEYISNTNDSEDFNILGVNYNGSVVENFYHPYKALFTDDVKRLSFKNVAGNKHLYLFAKTQILKQKSKYQYGYKFNGMRMNKQKIMLPINENNEPDYEYMENYMKQLELKKLKKYLEYKS